MRDLRHLDLAAQPLDRQLGLFLAAMPAEHRDDARWRYWSARALLETDAVGEGRERLGELAEQANFYGFLAADALDLPYSICPLEPRVETVEVDQLAERPEFARALELRRAGLPSWARREWNSAARGLDRAGLRTAAALATRENWPDRAIAALGNSGDLRWYEWRFPDPYRELVAGQAQRLALDSAWIMGLMRSESALAEDAVQSLLAPEAVGVLRSRLLPLVLFVHEKPTRDRVPLRLALGAGLRQQ